MILQITASSAWVSPDWPLSESAPSLARLNVHHALGASSWVAGKTGPEEWLEIDLECACEVIVVPSGLSAGNALAMAPCSSVSGLSE